MKNSLRFLLETFRVLHTMARYCLDDGSPRNPSAIKNIIVDDILFRQFGTHLNIQPYRYLRTHTPIKTFVKQNRDSSYLNI